MISPYFPYLFLWYESFPKNVQVVVSNPELDVFSSKDSGDNVVAVCDKETVSC